MVHLIVTLSFGLFLQAPPVVRHVDFPTDLGRWYAIDPPEQGSDRWIIAQSDIDHEWAVTGGGTGPRVDLRRGNLSPPLPFEIKPGPAEEGLSGTRTAEQVDDGWIVCLNAGEFGAGLWWFSPAGTRRYKISEEHAIGFAASRSGLLGVEGLAHGGATKGRIIRLSRDERRRWSSEPFLELGQAPQTFGMDRGGSLLVVTTDRLLRVVPSTKKIEVVLDNLFWGGFYPNSLVVDPSGTIFVGMRHGVAKIDKDNASYKIRWLLPSKEVANQQYVEGFE